MHRRIRLLPARITHILAFVGLAFLISACCGTHKPFETIDDKVSIRPGSIAVISSYPDEPTQRLAQELTQHLKERSTFKVMSQEEIARRLGKYPVTIKEGKPEQEDKPVWFSRTEKAKIDAIHAQLKTDYLFLVWTGNLTRTTVTNSRGGSSVTYNVSVDGNVVEYPKGRPVGFSVFGASKGKSCCLLGKSEGDDVNEMLKNAAGEMADKFIDAAKAERPGK